MTRALVAVLLVGCIDPVVVLRPEDAALGQPDQALTEPLPLPDRSLGAGDRHVCALTDGGLLCWGNNEAGQLGIPTDTMSSLRPVSPEPRDGWLAVDAYGLSTCGLRAGGLLYCWGANGKGQLGVGDTDDRDSPQLVPVRDVVDFDVGREFACALDGTGRLFCWGANFEGQLAQADPFGAADIPEPVQVGEDRDWVAVSAGNGHGCGIRNGDELYCWGRNTQNQLGLGSGSSMQMRRPTRVSGAWAAVSAAQNHTCAIDLDANLWCWGRNGDGQLGVGSGNRSEPARVVGVGEVRRVSTHWFTTCAVSTGGTLSCWGRNDEGQLRDDAGDVTEPLPLDPGRDWVAVAVSLFSLCGRREDGVVLCQGANSRGQLGRDTGGEVDATLAPVAFQR